MNPENINIVTTDNLHKSILQFIKGGEIIIGEYDDMKDCILKMIRACYFFNMDRDRLRDAMEDITFMLCPTDDINKDRVSRGLEYEYSDEEDSDDEYDGEESEIRPDTPVNDTEVEDIGDINDGSVVKTEE